MRLQTHPHADIFPAMSDEEFRLLFELVEAGTHRLSGICKTKRQFAFINPSTLEGFSYIHFVDEGLDMNGIKKPVRNSAIYALMVFMGIDHTIFSWKAEEADRADQEPFTPRNTAPEPDSSYVYFIQSDQGGPIKIGVAANPKKRIGDIQFMSPFPLKILAVGSGGYKAEALLHQHFAASRLHGEWFQPSPELLRLISELAQGAP